MLRLRDEFNALESFKDIPGIGDSLFYVGTYNTIDTGIKMFYEYLDSLGHIVVGEPQIFDYLFTSDQILYIIIHKSLPKLEYLEYLYQQEVDKNRVSKKV